MAALAGVVVALALPASALAAAPTATTEPATNVTSTTADVSGKLSPNLAATTFHWDYATDAEYTANSNGYPHSTADVLEGFQGIPFLVGEYTPATTLTGLSASTTYHFRFVASNADGTAKGTDLTFTTTS